MAAAKQCDNCGALYTYNPNAKYNTIQYGKIDSCMNWHPGEHLELIGLRYLRALTAII